MFPIHVVVKALLIMVAASTYYFLPHIYAYNGGRNYKVCVTSVATFAIF